MKSVIRIGDPMTYSAAVVRALSTTIINSKRLERQGGEVTSLRPGHDTVTNVEDDPVWLVDGFPVAFEGYQTSCDALLHFDAAVARA